MAKRVVEHVRCDVCGKEREGAKVCTIDYAGTVVVLDICPRCEGRPFADVIAAGSSKADGVNRGSTRRAHAVVPID
jgi:hypothetical protein